MKHIAVLFILVCSALTFVKAQGFGMGMESPVDAQCYSSVNGEYIEIGVRMIINKSWHVYGTEGEDGPTWTTINIEDIQNAKAEGKLMAAGTEHKVYDNMFECNVTFYEGDVTFSQKFKLTPGTDYKIEGYFNYGACNDMSCLPPTNVEFSFKGSAPAAATAATTPKEELAKAEPEKSTEPEELESESNTVAQPVAGPAPVAVSAASVDNIDAQSSLWLIFWSCFLAGFVALITPCVWPIIPMTVSFFLKRSQSRSKAITDATTYGLSIIIIYVALGIIVTLWKGASGLNDLSTNAIVNIFFALMLIVFGISFLGAFEITLPSSWSSAVDNKASQSRGFGGIFLMAFTLALVSFSCTGPIIGLLLVQLGTGTSISGPIVGMFGFALALALPFTFFALFPTLLQKMPRSGSWMMTVKAVLGFIELAFALKFLSVADLAYGSGLLPRETFIVIWAALALALGLYLWGVIKLEHSGPVEGIGTTRLLLGMASIAFCFYLIPGLWGAPLKAVSAFAPPMHTQDFVLGRQMPHAKYTSYEDGLQEAKRTGKPILIDFTGHGCVNCRQMEQAVWTDDRVADKLMNDYVLISLYVDDKRALPEGKTEVTERDGSKTILRTIGDKWSYFQRSRYGVNAQPFYVKLNTNEEIIGTPQIFTTSVDDFLKFLQ
ncbi:MAG: thioredoxin family protein [Bacteroidales bacterium]|nr:thioredoxin family protein [Bacteroidales bacterium]